MKNSIIGNRIMIIGCCGSGKSHLSMQLKEILSLPVLHLDRFYWKPGWVESSKEEWELKQSELASGSSWIIDGNYAGSFDIRFKRATTVIFLDYNKYVCTYRILKRWLKNIGKSRADIADACKEKMDMQFLKFVWSFPKKHRYKIMDKLDEYHSLNRIVLKNQKQTDELLRQVKQAQLKTHYN